MISKFQLPSVLVACIVVRAIANHVKNSRARVKHFCALGRLKHYADPIASPNPLAIVNLIHATDVIAYQS